MTNTVVPIQPGDSVTIQAPLAPKGIEVGVHLHGLWSFYWSNGQPTAQLLNHLDTLYSHDIQLVRVDVGIDGVAPTSSVVDFNSPYNVRLGRLVSELEGRGMAVQLNVGQSPAWMRPGTGTGVKQYPSNLVAWREVLRQLAYHFGTGVKYWEVWNEPNLAFFTGVSGENTQADKFVPVLREGYLGLKAGYAQAFVLPGGASQTAGSFIDAVYWRNGKDYMDAVTYHPYQDDQTKGPYSDDHYDKGRVTYTPSLLEHVAYWKDGGKPVHWSEVGFTVHSNAGLSNFWELGVPTDAQAAQYYVDLFNLAQERYATVKTVVLYAAFVPTGGVHMQGYSLINPDGSPTLRLQAVRDWITS